MTIRPLGITGVGVDLPEPVDVRAFAAARGAPVDGYRGWKWACHAGPDDHPSTMGARALDRALADARIPAADLRLVVYCGASRDYPPSWSVATEIMRLTGATDQCLGIDTTAGCLATLSGLDFAHGWLALRGGGHAAVVAAERWTHTIDHGDPASSALWGYGDGAAAAVVALDTGAPSRLQFVGAEFCSRAAFNGYVRIEYGGTRSPLAPAGEDPHRRRVVGRSRDEVIAAYRDGYSAAYAALQARFPTEPTHLVCNQISPGVVGIISSELGLSDRMTVTGHDTGHLGGPDVLVGLRRYLDEGRRDQAIVMAASASFAFGTGLLVADGSPEPQTPHAPPPAGPAGSTKGVTP
jgi:3-oxoacyl-[acyl-carrier-protein] synthase-3